MDQKKSETYFEKGQLPSLDQHGGRVNLIPAEVSGPWNKKKKLVHAALMLLLLALPWTQFNGVQTVLLNIPARQFTFFGTTLWAHESPLIFLVLITFALTLFLVTAVWGRVWCGWSCPQTVFIEFVYRPIEILVEGNYLQRRKMNAEPLSFSSFTRKSLKWFLFFLVSSFFAHSVAAYFIGSQELIRMTQGSPSDNITYFIIISFITLVLLFDFGWFREQFCIIMCPYGRLQSTLLDSNSMVVQYNAQRGEPRKGTPEATRIGDCVDCKRCVQVCPTGIDIRNGLQMECIACTACIDACDEIMTKVDKPQGLISYGTLSGKAVSFFRTRSLVYSVITMACFLALFYFLSSRAPYDITLLRVKEEPFQVVASTENKKIVTNHFKAHIKNQSNEVATLKIALDPSLQESNNVSISTPENPVTIEAGKDKTIHLFLINSDWKSKSDTRFNIFFNEVKKEMQMIGPHDG